MTWKLRHSQNFVPYSFCCLRQNIGPFCPPSQYSGALTQAELDVAASIVAALKTWSQEELAQRMKSAPRWPRKSTAGIKIGSLLRFRRRMDLRGDAFNLWIWLLLLKRSSAVRRRGCAFCSVWAVASSGPIRPGAARNGPTLVPDGRPIQHAPQKTQLPEMVGTHQTKRGNHGVELGQRRIQPNRPARPTL